MAKFEFNYNWNTYGARPLPHLMGMEKPVLAYCKTCGVEIYKTAPNHLRCKTCQGLRVEEKRKRNQEKRNRRGRDRRALTKQASQKCGECNGTGKIVNDGPHSPCDDCDGTGTLTLASAVTLAFCKAKQRAGVID